MKNRNKKIKSTHVEIKQAFLSSAISDISSYIHLTDTKVSIIMVFTTSIIAVINKYYETIVENIFNANKCSFIGIVKITFLFIFIISFIGVPIFGILTIRSHKSGFKFKSKWFIVDSIKDYPFDTYKDDIIKMTDTDILVNMAAELYKLNDINRQKLKTYKWMIRFLSILIFSMIILFLLVFL